MGPGDCSMICTSLSDREPPRPHLQHGATRAILQAKAQTDAPAAFMPKVERPGRDLTSRGLFHFSHRKTHHPAALHRADASRAYVRQASHALDDPQHRQHKADRAADRGGKLAADKPQRPPRGRPVMPDRLCARSEWGRGPPCKIGKLGREGRDVSASRERPASRQQSRQPSGPDRRREASPRRNN